MKKHCILLLILLTLSCTNEQQVTELKYSPFIGEYKILSLTSDIQLDLNRDGIPTKNYLDELSSYFNLYIQYDNPILLINKSNDVFKNSFYDDVPKQFVNPTDVNDITFGKAGPIKTLQFNDNFTSIVNIDGFYTDDFYRQQKWAILQNVTVINNNKIKANFEQQYFTIETGWKTCILTAIFTKK